MYSADALISLSPSDKGGIAGPIEEGVRSFLLCFGSDDAEELIKLGVSIVSRGSPKPAPGLEDVPVRLTFWADEARLYARPGVPFTIWYGRTIGEGLIVDEAPV